MLLGAFHLARGDNADPSLSNLILVLFCLFMVGMVALLAFVPVRVAAGVTIAKSM